MITPKSSYLGQPLFLFFVVRRAEREITRNYEEVESRDAFISLQNEEIER